MCHIGGDVWTKVENSAHIEYVGNPRTCVLMALAFISVYGSETIKLCILSTSLELRVLLAFSKVFKMFT